MLWALFSIFLGRREERSDCPEIEIGPDEKPHEDEARAGGVDDHVGNEKGRAVRKECLACFHDDPVSRGRRDGENGVSSARELSVVGRVGERGREGGVGDDVSPVRELDNGETDVVDRGFRDGDKQAIADDPRDDGDCRVSDGPWEQWEREHPTDGSVGSEGS